MAEFKEIKLDITIGSGQKDATFKIVKTGLKEIEEDDYYIVEAYLPHNVTTLAQMTPGKVTEDCETLGKAFECALTMAQLFAQEAATVR